MRTDRNFQRRVRAGNLTPTTGADQIGITADFDGGPVLASAMVLTNIGAGQWVQIMFKVDGVAQGPDTTIWQTQANVAAALVLPLFVPQGRHRVSLYTNASVAFPAGATLIDLSIAE